jgi:hypothetical protein
VKMATPLMFSGMLALPDRLLIVIVPVPGSAPRRLQHDGIRSVVNDLADRVEGERWPSLTHSRPGACLSTGMG